MKLTDKDGVIVDAVVTAEHSSSYGQPVLVLDDGTPYGPAEADAEFGSAPLIECTLEEWAALYRGRYYSLLQRAPKERIMVYLPLCVVEALEAEVTRRRRRAGRRINTSLVISVCLAEALQRREGDGE